MQPLWKTVGRFLKKLKIEPPYHPAIPLLGIYPRDKGVLFQRDTCNPMFIAALSTITKVWKEPKFPSMDEGIKKMWCIYMYIYTPHIYTHIYMYTHTHTHTHTHTVEYYSAIKKNEILSFATTWRELEGIMLSTIRERQIPYDFTHIRTLRKQNR